MKWQMHCHIAIYVLKTGVSAAVIVPDAGAVKRSTALDANAWSVAKLCAKKVKDGRTTRRRAGKLKMNAGKQGSVDVSNCELKEEWML